MEFTADDAEALTKVLRWRRDVRHFRSDPVPETTMGRLRDAMALAPSVGNARPWRVLRVQNSGLRNSVRLEFERCNAAAAAEYDEETRSEYSALKLAGLAAAPEHLAIFTATDPAAGRRLGRRTMPETLHQPTAMAIHTLWLAARAENLGLGMVSILEPARMERIFDVPESWEFSAYICLGWPEFTDDTPLLHRVGWQKNQPTEWMER
ncbi:MAG: 5,6-dimethylbenzimidazole synthase [Paracoccaceae bacterium]|nr:5,6-dimethylbenzimidazole synthase [Paracoccaceae bacterium]MDH5529112.1 5,6-dimethylbenzimidazole synthase [Paracoccaceae bacterium]